MAEDAKAAAPMEWPHTVKLERPVEFAGDTISSLTFQRGKLKFLRGMTLERTPTVDEAVLIASRLCGQPVQVIEELEGKDAGEAVAVALAFFARCLGTTEST